MGGMGSCLMCSCQYGLLSRAELCYIQQTHNSLAIYSRGSLPLLYYMYNQNHCLVTHQMVVLCDGDTGWLSCMCKQRCCDHAC